MPIAGAFLGVGFYEMIYKKARKMVETSQKVKNEDELSSLDSADGSDHGSKDD
jgi:hypothetical protein